MDDQIAEVLDGLDRLEAAARVCLDEDWHIGVSDTDSVEGAAVWASESVLKGAGDRLHMVFIGDPDNPDDTKVIALTGNGEHSEARAIYLASVCPRNVLVLIEVARHALMGAKHED